jgi:hypothetical protein
MNSGILNYQPPSFTGLMSHDSVETLLLHDWNFNHNLSNRNAVDVQVRSGDYFVTLATVLDGLAGDADAYVIRAELENIVSDLIYLQDNYNICKNDQREQVDRD